MRRVSVIVALFLVTACGGGSKEESPFRMSRDPVSVRGWIFDVAGAKRATSPDLELARRSQLFMSSSVWVEGSQYASGGIAENGAFVVLDVPPDKAILGFNAPGAETAKVTLQNIPGNADVIIPNLILENGGAKVLDPKLIKVRIPAYVDKARPTGKTAIVAGYPVPVMETPLAELADRRDYPDPGGIRPVAIVR